MMARALLVKLQLVSGEPQKPNDDKSTFASGNGLVLLGNKPLPETMLSHIYEFSIKI